MANVKINENEFLGVQEYNRLKDSFSKLGMDRNFLLNTSKFGFFGDFQLPDLNQILREDCFYARKAGTPFDDIIVQKGIAVDLNANLIVNESDQNITIPNDNSWYWVRVSHAFSTKEKGKVSIDALGNLSGVGTEFTKILRGQPKFPSKIKFFNSINQNVYEYEVVKVSDDQNAVLFGDFNAETNLDFSVIGTFTPGAFVPDSNKNIFQYDSVLIELVQEVNLNTPPFYISGQQFYISRVKNTGTDVVLQDKRIDWFKTDAFDRLSDVNRLFDNPLIGVESVKYDISTSTKDKNIVELCHGFRFSSYTVDTSSKKISILIGQGGVFKSTSQFEPGQFDYWRLYLKNGSFVTIIDSQKTGSQIVLTVDVLNPDDVGAADLLFITPPYENIEIKCKIPAYIDTEKIFEFKANTPICRFTLNTLDGCVLYNMVYRYKNNSDYTDWKVFPDDAIGHYAETSFTPTGELKPLLEDRTFIPYTGSETLGFIKICESPNSYDNFQQLINVGDLFGVNTTELANAEPTINLIVGTSKRYQHYKGAITLSADMFIVLNSLRADATPLREGNEFFLHFEQFIDLLTFKLRIVQNFVNPTNFEEVCLIDANDCAFIRNNVGGATNGLKRGLFIRCTYNDKGKWIAHYDTELRSLGDVRMINSVPSGAFINNIGVMKGYHGWRLMTEMAERFPQGTSNLSGTGAFPLSGTGGVNLKNLSVANIPPHDHYIFSTSDNGGGQYCAQGHSTGGNLGYGIAPTNTVPNFGKTGPGGGTGGAATPFDIRPSYKNFAYLEKIV